MIIQYIRPSAAFFYSVLFFNFLPGLYIYIFEEYEMLYKDIDLKEYETATLLYIYIVAGFSVLVFLSLLFFRTFVHRSQKHSETVRGFDKDQSTSEILDVESNKQFYKYTLSKKNWVLKMGYLGVFFVIIYFITGGYEKITAYGSGMDAWEFRIIGYGDRFAGLTAILEISRKIFLPFACLYFMNYATIKYKKLGLRNYMFLFFLLLAGIMTFDRAPILLFFVLILFKKFSLGASMARTIVLPFFLILGIVFIAGLTTYIQYNITEFSFISIFEMGIGFFLHRTVVVPSIASIQLSFHWFPFGSEKLNLEFSRLGALFGRDYVSIRTDDISIFVSPVGFIADIWRNLGVVGCVIVALFLGYYFALLDYLIEKLDPLSKIAASFTSVSLCFYFIFGVFFSQGVFAQLFFLVFVAVYLQKDGVKKQLTKFSK